MALLPLDWSNRITCGEVWSGWKTPWPAIVSKSAALKASHPSRDSSAGHNPVIISRLKSGEVFAALVFIL